jgi:hypothetical protein
MTGLARRHAELTEQHRQYAQQLIAAIGEAVHRRTYDTSRDRILGLFELAAATARQLAPLDVAFAEHCRQQRQANREQAVAAQQQAVQNYAAERAAERARRQAEHVQDYRREW